MFLMKDESDQRIQSAPTKMVNRVYKFYKSNKERYMRNQEGQQCVTDAVIGFLYYICNGAQISSPWKGKSRTVEEAREGFIRGSDACPETLLLEPSRKKGRTGVKLQGREIHNIFREFQGI